MALRFRLLPLLFALLGCSASPDRPATAPAPDGEALAQQYCVSCHQYPAPALLDRSTWETYVLPRMGYLMGRYPSDSVRQQLLEKGAGGARVMQRNVFPVRPWLDDATWQKIVDYYRTEAPDTLPRPADTPITPGLPGFTVKTPPYQLSPPSTTLVRFREGQGLFVADAHTQRLYQFDAQLRLQQAANVGEAAVALEETDDQLRLTVMGSFSPTDAPSGQVLALPTQPGLRPGVVLGNLQRPVHTAYADLNGDGREDLVTCEFAKWTGGLSWWELTTEGRYRRHALREKPGATQVYVHDLNGDARPDLIALFGQGDEGIFLYYNEGEGSFREERALAFPPSWGSSALTLVDWNDDGAVDLLYTNGDNADYPPLLKPYHGIRLYLNDGQQHFTEQFFYPMHGAYRAVAADFDQDGDRDLAAIAFFPDFAHRPEAAFQYLENRGDDHFTAYTFPQVTDGRWLVLEVGDLEGDGDLDLALGSLAFEVIPPGDWVARWTARGLPFVVLENTLH